MTSSTLTASQAGFSDHLKAIPQHFADLVDEEPKDTLECVITALEGIEYTGASDETKAWCGGAASQLDPYKKAFSFFSLPSKLNGMRRGINKLQNSDDWSKVTPQLFTDTVFTAHAASESALCLDAFGWVELTKEAMSFTKGVFWSALGIFDLHNLFITHPDKLNDLEVEIGKSKDADKLNILNHKINRTYIEVVKSVLIVGMAAISLVSLTFASVAQGVLFSPGLFFTMGASWSALFLVSFFYGKMIDVEERHLQYWQV